MLLLILIFAASDLAAQSIGRYDLAQAVQQNLVDAIAAAEPSVVAIARVSRDASDERLDVEFRPDPFGRPANVLRHASPTDPDFIPNDYAAGVVVDSRGLVLTTCHAFAPNCDYYVTAADRRVYQATIRAADPRSDLAVLAIKAVNQDINLKPIRFGYGRPLRKGQFIIALGNPSAIARDGQASAALGIIANLARKAASDPTAPSNGGKMTIHHYGTLVQTDLQLSADVSGGALVDLTGRMVGLLTSLAPSTGYQRTAGYAIPVDETFRRIVETLKQGREVEYGFLGVHPANLSEEEILAGLRGARVDQIIPGPGGPATAGGLKPTDIITAVGGVAIADADQLILEVGRHRVDAVVPITVVRRGRIRTIDVRLGKYPVRGPKIITDRPDSWRGLDVDHATVAADPPYEKRGEPTYLEDAVLIVEVRQESPAWCAGLRPGMSISHVAGRKVRTPGQFRESVAGRTGPVAVRLTEPDSPERTITPES